MNQRRQGAAGMTAAMVISGTIGLFVVLSDQPVTDVVFFRCLFGAATLLLACTLAGLLRPGVMSLKQLSLAALGGVAIVANWWLLFAAFPMISISVATTVYHAQPFMLVGLSALFLGERTDHDKLGWLALGFVGTGLVVLARPEDGGAGGNYLLGIALALSAAFFYAVATLVAKALKGVPPHLVALVQVSVGALALAPWVQDNAGVTAENWVMLGTLGVVHTGLMYVLLYGAVQKLPSSLVGALAFVYPVVAVAVDRIFFGVTLAPIQGMGMLLIVGSACAVNAGLSFVTPRRGAAYQPEV